VGSGVKTLILRISFLGSYNSREVSGRPFDFRGEKGAWLPLSVVGVKYK